MITVIHSKPNTFVLKTLPRLMRFEVVSDLKFNYHSGITKPNYPMPAKYDDYSNPNVWDCVLGYYVKFG